MEDGSVQEVHPRRRMDHPLVVGIELLEDTMAQADHTLMVILKHGGPQLQAHQLPHDSSQFPKKYIDFITYYF